MHLVLKNDVAELARLMTSLDGFRAEESLPESLRLPLHLIAEEVFVNIVHHGIPQATAGSIDVLAERRADAVRLEFRDRGVPFNPLTKSRPDLTADVLQRPIGGLGVELSRQLSADQLEYHRIDGENRLQIRLPLPG